MRPRSRTLRRMSAARGTRHTGGRITHNDAAVWSGRTSREWLPEIVADIVRVFDPLKIILFGSLARGEEGPDSDIDLLVVLPHVAAERKAALMGDVRAAITAPVPVDVFVADPAEIARRSHLTGSILYPAVREGILLHERAA